MTRRDFLKTSILGIGGILTSFIGILGGGFFLSPIWTKRKNHWAEIGSVADIPIGEPVKVNFVQRRRDGWVTIEGQSSAWIYTADREKFDVFDPRCTHLGCPYNWNRSKKQFLCPCHNGIFGEDGRIISGPVPRPLDRLEYKVVGNKLYVLPHKKG